MNRQLETDGVPATSDYEFWNVADVNGYQRRIRALTDEVARSHREVEVLERRMTHLAAEVERLRGALSCIGKLANHARSDTEHDALGHIYEWADAALSWEVG